MCGRSCVPNKTTFMRVPGGIDPCRALSRGSKSRPRGVRDRGFRGLIPSSTYRSVGDRAERHGQRINRDATGRAPRQTGVRRARRGTCFVSSTAKTHGVATKRGSNPKKRPFSWVSRPHQKTSIFEPSVRYRLGETRVLTTGHRYAALNQPLLPRK